MTKLNQYVLSNGKHTRVMENGTRVIVSQHEDGYTVELELSNGFETEQAGPFDSVKAALEACRRWAKEDWSDYQ